MLAAVLTREPDWNALPAATPPSVRRLLRRCLERNPKNRLHDIADARDRPRRGARAGRRRKREPPRSHTRAALERALPWAVAGALALALRSASGRPGSRPREPASPCA